MNRKAYQEKEHLYKRRQAIVEHPYGTLKRQWGFNYILTKIGMKRASADVGFMVKKQPFQDNFFPAISLGYNISAFAGIDLNQMKICGQKRILDKLPLFASYFRTESN